MALRPIFYDTETTGLDVAQDRIIELAAFDPVQGKTFSSLINPNVPIPPEVTAIHGIRDEDVAQAPSFRDVGKDFIHFCEGEVVLIAHNNDAFDSPFLSKEYARHQLDLPSWVYFDSLKWARRYRPDLPKHSLQYLREHFRIPLNRAHRALDDVFTLHKVFALMTEDLTLEEILSLFTSSDVRELMPFGKYAGYPLKELPPSYVKWLATSGAFEKPQNHELKERFAKLGLL